MPETERFIIKISNRQQQFECAENQVLLIGMERRNKRGIRVGCRGGGCGVCKIKILEGEYQAKTMSRAHISQQEQQQGFVLACRVYPRSDIVLEADHYIAPKAKQNQITAASLAERINNKNQT